MNCECGKEIDAALTVDAGDADDRPEPGDFTACANCGRMYTLEEGGRLRPATPEELAALPPADARRLKRLREGYRTRSRKRNN